MSTCYSILGKAIPFSDLFGGSLARFGIVEECVPDQTTETRRCLTDKQNYLWVYDSPEGGITFKRCGLNTVGYILKAIEQTFHVEIVSEYEPQFWGFANQEEWDVAKDAMAKKDRETFYMHIKNFVAGQPSGIRPGTVGAMKAEIAKALLEKRPDLALPNAKDDLMNLIDAIYDQDHAVIVKLDEKDMALVAMITTHSRDLPSC